MITYVVITMVCAFIFLTVKYFEYAHKFRDGGDFSGDYYSPVDLVGLYWHLVDIIWIYLFPLLYLIR